MDVNVNITGINENEKNPKNSYSFDPRIIMDPDFKTSIELTGDKIDNMIEEVDKYYNIYDDPEVSFTIRKMLRSRAEFLDSYRNFKDWFKRNR